MARLTTFLAVKRRAQIFLTIILVSITVVFWVRLLTCDGDVESNPGPGRGGGDGRGRGAGRGRGKGRGGGRGGVKPPPNFTANPRELGFFKDILTDVAIQLNGESCVDTVLRTFANMSAGKALDQPLTCESTESASIEEMKRLHQLIGFAEMWAATTQVMDENGGQRIALRLIRIGVNRLNVLTPREASVAHLVVCYSATTPDGRGAHWVVGRRRSGLRRDVIVCPHNDDWLRPLAELNDKLVEVEDDDVPRQKVYKSAETTMTSAAGVPDAPCDPETEERAIVYTALEEARAKDLTAGGPICEEQPSAYDANQALYAGALLVGPIPPPAATDRVGVVWRPEHGVHYDDHRHEIAQRAVEGTLCECLTYPRCSHARNGIYVQADPTKTFLWRELFAAAPIRLIAPAGANAVQLGDKVLCARTQRAFDIRGSNFSTFRVRNPGCFRDAFAHAVRWSLWRYGLPFALGIAGKAAGHVATVAVKEALKPFIPDAAAAKKALMKAAEPWVPEPWPLDVLAEEEIALPTIGASGGFLGFPSSTVPSGFMPPRSARSSSGNWIDAKQIFGAVGGFAANCLKTAGWLCVAAWAGAATGMIGVFKAQTRIGPGVIAALTRDAQKKIRCFNYFLYGAGVARAAVYFGLTLMKQAKRPEIGGTMGGWQFVTPTRIQAALVTFGYADYERVEPEFEEAVGRFIGPTAIPKPVLSMLRRAALIDNGDEVTARGLLVRAAVETDYGFRVHKETMKYLIRTAVKASVVHPGRTKKTINADTVIVAQPRGNLVAGPKQACYWCDLPFTSASKFPGRMCPHHYAMLTRNSYPRADTIDALLASELGHKDYTVLGGYRGPVVSMPEFKPMKGGMTFFPLDKMFSEKMVPVIEYLLTAKEEVVLAKTVVGVGYSIATQGVTTIAKGKAAIAQALVCRVGQVPRMEPQPYAFDLGIKVLRRLISARGVEPMSFLHWLGTVRRKTDMMAAHQEIVAVGGPEMWVREHKKPKWKAFVKQEKIPSGEKVQKPRIIQAPPDAVHVILGRKMKTILHELAKEWTWDSEIFYAGCARPLELHRWLGRLAELTNYQFLCIDYKMFDCTHSRLSFEMVETIYAEICNMSDDDRILLKNLRIPRGRAQNVTYKAPKEMNGSGRPDTSLLNIVNSITALAIMCTVIITGKEVSEITVEDVLTYKHLWLIAASGDDSVVAVPKTAVVGGKTVEIVVDKALVEKTIGTFGFDAAADKVNIFSDFSEIVFLGHRPYPVSDGCGGKQWFWGPTLGRRLYKHHHFMNPSGDIRAWLHGVAQMERLNYPHVPILHDMAVNICDQFIGQKKNDFFDREACYKPVFTSEEYSPPHYDDVTIEHVERIYGMGPGDVKSCIASLGAVPQAVDHQALYRCLEVDDL